MATFTAFTVYCLAGESSKPGAIVPFIVKLGSATGGEGDTAAVFRQLTNNLEGGTFVMEDDDTGWTPFTATPANAFQLGALVSAKGALSPRVYTVIALFSKAEDADYRLCRANDDPRIIEAFELTELQAAYDS